jgi:hypothetical protein
VTVKLLKAVATVHLPGVTDPLDEMLIGQEKLIQPNPGVYTPELGQWCCDSRHQGRFGNRNFAIGSMFSFVLGIGLYGLTYLYPVYLAQVRLTVVLVGVREPPGG